MHWSSSFEISSKICISFLVLPKLQNKMVFVFLSFSTSSKEDGKRKGQKVKSGEKSRVEKRREKKIEQKKREEKKRVRLELRDL